MFHVFRCCSFKIGFDQNTKCEVSLDFIPYKHYNRSLAKVHYFINRKLYICLFKFIRPASSRSVKSQFVVRIYWSHVPTSSWLFTLNNDQQGCSKNKHILPWNQHFLQKNSVFRIENIILCGLYLFT